MIEINLDEYEINKEEKGYYYYLSININDNNFSGWTKCVFPELSWNQFINDLEEFLNFRKEKVTTYTGWGDETYFSINITLKDKMGHIWISGEIGYPIIANKNQNPSISHKLFYSFKIDMITLEKFMNNLKSIKRIRRVIL